MKLVHWIGSPVFVFFEGNNVSLAFGFMWAAFLLLLPFILPLLTSFRTSLKLMISVSWLIPWIALNLFWLSSGLNKGVGNVFFEGASTLVICSALSATLFLLRARFRRFYPFGFLLASACVVGVSYATPFIGK